MHDSNMDEPNAGLDDAIGAVRWMLLSGVRTAMEAVQRHMDHGDSLDEAIRKVAAELEEEAAGGEDTPVT